MDLGDGADGGAGVTTGRLLVDGNGRREPLYELDVRLLHLAQELASVRRQALHIAALTLCVDGVEGQARLTRAGEPCENDEALSRQLERQVLEVVLAGPADDDLFQRQTVLERSGAAIVATPCDTN